MRNYITNHVINQALAQLKHLKQHEIPSVQISKHNTFSPFSVVLSAHYVWLNNSVGSANQNDTVFLGLHMGERSSLNSCKQFMKQKASLSLTSFWTATSAAMNVWWQHSNFVCFRKTIATKMAMMQRICLRQSLELVQYHHIILFSSKFKYIFFSSLLSENVKRFNKYIKYFMQIFPIIVPVT